jgi:peptidoglycan L-alanyl-D-glutamate endopeptidase CwlK
MASRRLEDLSKTMQPLCRAFLDKCRADGMDVIIICTYRSSEEQNREYSKGRTTSSGIGVTAKRPLGRTVTNAKGGQSYHNRTDSQGNPAAEAFDFLPLHNGKAVWNTTGQDFELWLRAGEIGESLGLVWGGRFKMRDYPHMQLKT